ncbi:hypothetical protein IAR50_005474 [Cryptococcus sp. DSM 104548]
MAAHHPLPQTSLATPNEQHGIPGHMRFTNPYSVQKPPVSSGAPSRAHPSTASSERAMMARGRGEYGPQLRGRESTDNGERRKEREPMLPPTAHTRPRTQEPMLVKEDSSIPPAPPPKAAARAPTSPTTLGARGGGEHLPLSKRLFHALVNKPRLSKTWEKESFGDEMKSAPASLSEHEGLGRREVGPREDYASSRSRPTSLYASPADLASFRPLPLMMEERHHHSDSEVGNIAAEAEGVRV